MDVFWFLDLPGLTAFARCLLGGVEAYNERAFKREYGINASRFKLALLASLPRIGSCRLGYLGLALGAGGCDYLLECGKAYE